MRWLSNLFKSKADLGEVVSEGTNVERSAPAAQFGCVGYQVSWSQTAQAVSSRKVIPQVSSEPDLPQAFGYKVGWFAVATEDAALVARVLGLVDEQVANWQTGLKAASERDVFSNDPSRWVFLTPPLDGWVLVVGQSLPYPVEVSDSQVELEEMARKFDGLLSRLASHFDDVQYFASHRVSDFVTWTRRTGSLYRSFTYGDGWVYRNRGSQTTTERDRGMPDLTGMTLQDATNELFRLLGEEQKRYEESPHSGLSHREAMQRRGSRVMPGERDATDLAAAWSVDPTQIEERYREKSVGALGLLKFDR